MTLNPLVTLPSVRQIAINALKAHKAGKLQATSPRKVAFVSRCMYYDDQSKTKCVLGASMSWQVAKQLDHAPDNTITQLYDDGLVRLADYADLEKLRYLQQLHDRAFASTTERERLLDALRRYAK